LLNVSGGKSIGTGWPQAVILCLFLLGGCGGKVEQTHRAAGYDPLAADGMKYAVGGFVLGAGVEVVPETGDAPLSGFADDPAAQSDAWAPALYGPLLAMRGGRDVWDWSALRDNIPTDEITALQTAIARGEVPAAGSLAKVAGDLPDITYLAVARLDRNEIMVSNTAPTGLRTDQSDPGGDVGAPSNSLLGTVRIRRTVEVTLEVFDLRGGRSVWRGSVERQRTELLSSKSITESEDLVVIPPTGEDELPEIRVKGTALAAPALEDLLAEACEALVGNLFAVAQ
jgi:hypothetical protein